MSSRNSLRHRTVTALIITPLVLWTATTIATQLGRGQRLARTIDPTGLVIPDWRFFAPIPAEHEYHLLYRDERSDGTTTAWQEISFGQRRTLLHLVWARTAAVRRGCSTRPASFCRSRTAPTTCPSSSSAHPTWRCSTWSRIRSCTPRPPSGRSSWSSAPPNTSRP